MKKIMHKWLFDTFFRKICRFTQTSELTFLKTDFMGLFLKTRKIIAFEEKSFKLNFLNKIFQTIKNEGIIKIMRSFINSIFFHLEHFISWMKS
jgi:hypothetical protein